MNTVKRWLAGLLSFAMIFTSSAFMNVGTVFAAEIEGQTSADKAGVELTIGETTTYIDNLTHAIAEANKANDVNKLVYVTLLKDSNEAINAKHPMIIDFNGFAYDGVITPAVGEQTAAKVTIKGEKYTLCTGGFYSGSELVGYNVAVHESTPKYVWDVDPNYETNNGEEELDPIWKVKSKATVCENCGTHDGELPYLKKAPLFANYYNEQLKQYEYYEWTKSDVPDWAKASMDDYKLWYNSNAVNEEFLKSTMSTEGYTITEGPTFVMDGSRVRHDEKGQPVVDVTVRKNQDGSKVEDPDVALAVASTTEKANNVWVKPNGAAGGDGDFVAKDATCKTYGTELYKVIVKDPDGKELTTRYIQDTDGKMVDHKPGTVKKFQILVKVGNAPSDVNQDGTHIEYNDFYKTEGEAIDAAADLVDGGVEVVDVTSERFDAMKGTETYNPGERLDGIKDTTAYFFWYWADVKTTDVETDGANVTAKFDGFVDQPSIAILGPDFNFIEEDGSFVYRPVFNCYYEQDDADPTEIIGAVEPVEPMDKITKPEDLAKLDKDMTTGYHKPTMSSCEIWRYEPISADNEKEVAGLKISGKYTIYGSDVYENEFDRPESGKEDYTNYPTTGKNGTSYWMAFENTDPSHVVDKPSVVWPATCGHIGFGEGTCKYCGEDTFVVLDKLNNHKPADGGIFTGDFDALTSDVVDPELAEFHKVKKVQGGATVSAIVRVEPTCTEDGGLYQFCTGVTPGHWYRTEKIDKLGHDLSTTVSVLPKEQALKVDTASYWDSNESWNVYRASIDHVFVAKRRCGNETGTDIYKTVRYHSVPGIDTDSDKYSAVTVVTQAAGEDCTTKAKVVYTVEELKDSATGKAVTIGFDRPDAFVGNHKEITPKSFNWSNDFEAATAVGTCTLCKRENVELDATVTQTTSEDGITTFTAKYGDKSETKKAFTLKNAIVSFDETLIKDGNSIYNGDELPDVTVTINGTVIKSSLYYTVWGYSNQKKIVTAEVEWTEAVKKSGKANVVAGTKRHSAHVDAGKLIDAQWTYNLNGVRQVEPTYEITGTTEAYDPDNFYEVVPVVIPDDATIKYSVISKPIDDGNVDDMSREEYVEYMKKVKALTYDKDEVVLHDAGEYYVYAKIEADGYTSIYEHVATFIIGHPAIYVQIDDLTVTVGEDPLPKLAKRAYWTGAGVDGWSIVSGGTPDSVANVNWDEDFKITTVGGKALKDLDAGVYKLNVQAPNYSIQTVNATNIGTLTVIPKDQTVVDAEKIAEELANAKTDDELAAAYAKYAALSDELKKIVESNAAAKANLEKAKAAYDAKQAAEKKAADEKAAGNVINLLATVTDSMSQADAKKIVDAFNALTADQKALVNANATAKANLAKAQSIANKPAPKNPAKSSYKFTKTKYTIKAGKSAKIKGKKTTDGKLTFKKTKGNKKITVTKGGKIKVKKKGLKKGKTYKIKVKVTAPATANYTALKVTKQIKVKVK